MFYILYQVTNTVNGKIYVGVHKTKKLDDGYMGSGKVIQRAIAKYGIENFTRIILEQFENSTAMFAREKEVVTEEFLAREDTYNLRRGGFGGWDYIHSNNIPKFLGKKHSQESINKRTASRHGFSPSQETRDKISVSNQLTNESRGMKVSMALTGVPKSEEHRRNIGESLKGKTKGIKKPNRKPKSTPVVFDTVTCPHCGKVGKLNAMNRWHFENCKHKGVA